MMEVTTRRKWREVEDPRSSQIPADSMETHQQFLERFRFVTHRRRRHALCAKERSDVDSFSTIDLNDKSLLP
jgi:hypothetical protein